MGGGLRKTKASLRTQRGLPDLSDPRSSSIFMAGLLPFLLQVHVEQHEAQDDGYQEEYIRIGAVEDFSPVEFFYFRVEIRVEIVFRHQGGRAMAGPFKLAQAIDQEAGDHGEEKACDGADDILIDIVLGGRGHVRPGDLLHNVLGKSQGGGVQLCAVHQLVNL